MPGWSGNKALSGAATGAGIGSTWGPAGTLIGGAAGGLLGGILGGNAEDTQNKYTQKVEGLLQETPYQSFLSTSEGQDVNNTLQAQINRQYANSLKEGKITAGRNVQAREMLSSNILPRETNILRKDLAEVRAGQQNALQNTLADAEISKRQDYETKELQKKVLLSNLWASAGTAAGTNYSDLMSNLAQVGGNFALQNLISKYGDKNETYYTGGPQDANESPIGNVRIEGGEGQYVNGIWVPKKG